MKEVGAGGQNTYRYDGDGARVKVVANGSAPIYYVKSSVLGQVAMEIEGSQAVLNRAYVYASGKLIAEQTPDGQFYWTHNDHLGSTRRLTNTSGTVVYRGEFDPFGKTVLETGSVSLNSHKYTGYERDWATGLDYANARMYASLRGRFMQSDPVTQGCGNRKPDILAGANQWLPESLNRYGYVRNDPVNLIDPSGLVSLPVDGGDGENEKSGCFWPLLGCLMGILGYVRVITEIAACPETIGLGCLLALLEHAGLAVLIAKECPQAAKSCRGLIPYPKPVILI